MKIDIDAIIKAKQIIDSIPIDWENSVVFDSEHNKIEPEDVPAFIQSIIKKEP
jgi:hypothetical protein